jgi:hypothetical protein
VSLRDLREMRLQVSVLLFLLQEGLLLGSSIGATSPESSVELFRPGSGSTPGAFREVEGAMTLPRPAAKLPAVVPPNLLLRISDVALLGA